MQIVFRLAYSLVVAILFVLFVILGTRTFYDEPEPPPYPERPFPRVKLSSRRADTREACSFQSFRARPCRCRSRAPGSNPKSE